MKDANEKPQADPKPRKVGIRKKVIHLLVSLVPFLLLSVFSEHLLDKVQRENFEEIQNYARNAVESYTPWGLIIEYFDLLGGGPERREHESDTQDKMIKLGIDGGERLFSENMKSQPSGGENEKEPSPLVGMSEDKWAQLNASIDSVKIESLTDVADAMSKRPPYYGGILIRPFCALGDVVLYRSYREGTASFVVTLLQLALGGGLMFLLSRRAKLAWTRNIMVFPIGAVVMGSVAAIPIWLFTRLVVLVTGGAIALAGLAGMTTSYTYAAVWLTAKVTEYFGHEAIAKRLSLLVGL